MSTIQVNQITNNAGEPSIEIGNGGSVNYPNIGRKNVLINGDFSVSQRGVYTSLTALATETYSLDRWISVFSGVTGQVQQLSDMPTGLFGKSAKIVATSTGSAQLCLEQRIEVAEWMKGQTLTASAWVRSNSAVASINVFNNIGSFATPVNHSGNGTWEKLSLTVTIPTGAVTDLRVRIGLSQSGNTTVTSGDYVDMTLAQFEIGEAVTHFERRSAGEELALCQRYYQKSFNSSSHLLYSGYAVNGSTETAFIDFPVYMRTSPSITRINTGNSAFGSTPSETTSSVSRHTESRVGTATGNGVFASSWEADAEL